MNAPDLISFEKAAARLHVSESGLEELIDSGQLHTHPYVGDIHLDNNEVAALVRSQRPKDPTTQRPAFIDWSPLARIRDLKESGILEVSAPHAAKLLNLKTQTVSHLICKGRLNAEKRGRHRWIHITEVEMYAMDQAHWSSLSGAWTPYGKQDRRDPNAGLILASEARAGLNLNARPPEGPNADDYLLLTKQAADILGVTVDCCFYLCNRYGIQPTKIKSHHANRDSSGRPYSGNYNGYSARAIYALAAKRDRSRANSSPKEWRERVVKPLIRTKIEAPPGDVLITRAEAAEVLGIHISAVSGLVGRGRLFGWQTHPGKPRCPLYLSANQVHRYASDPDRLKRREAFFARRGPAEPSPLGEETDRELWLEDVGLAAAFDRVKRSNTERDYGEFFSTPQAARLLGVTPASVHSLRRRGRISGYQRPLRKGSGVGRRWWFYRKDDVYNLLADGEYLRRHERGRRASLLSLGAEIPNMETEWGRDEG